MMYATKMQVKYLCFYLLFLVFNFLPSQIFAQFQDDFSDGNFTQNPVWLGDTADFVVNQSNTLQLNAVAAGTAQIYALVPTADSTVWEFLINMDFSPSASNQLKVYLSSDNANFSTSLNGYYLLIGETGADDAIELYRQDGTNSTVIIRATDGYVSAEPVLVRVRVVRDRHHNWSIFVDYSGGNNFGFEGSVIDSTHMFGQFFGLLCKYTSTRVDKFLFDDFYIAPLYQDIEAPQIRDLEVLSEHELKVIFNENLDVVTAMDISNYSVDNGIGQPTVAVLDSIDDRVVHLVFGNDFQDGLTNQLAITNIEDLTGNSMGTEVFSFQYYEVQSANLYDIIINEIFADPTPSIGLPEVEFIEIYNRSSKNINLENYAFVDASKQVLLPDIILLANEYAIICDEEAISQFQQFGKVIGVENFPNLTNAGEVLQLRNAADELVDVVEYDISWYQDANKSGGGWTLERIYVQQPCLLGIENWRASRHLLGGTPATENSVISVNLDTKKPELVSVFPIDSIVLELVFSESVDISTLQNIDNYILSDGLSVAFATIDTPSLNTVLLTLSAPLHTEKIYTITIKPTLTDCVNNSFSTTKNELRVALPQLILSNDLLINEVLSNPATGGSDFVEVYNYSNKVFDLSDLIIGSADAGLVDDLKAIEQKRLIFPGEYLVLTEDKLDIQNRYVVEYPNSIIETDLPSYPDDEGSVVLVSNGEIIDWLTYSESFHFELLDDKNGVSLERISFSKATQDEDNWHSAASTVGYATPSYLNSQAINTEEVAEEFWLESTTFSPDSDGFEDVLLINYQLDNPDFLATIRVFDSKGQQIKTLINNQLLGAKGIVKWDGTTANQVKAKVGIYILHIHLFTPDGLTYEVKKTCVLAGKL